MSIEGKGVAKEIAELLREKNLTLSIAESCTGGLVGDLITSIPGSSNYFIGGIVAYSNRIKKELLSVSRETLRKYGTVSREVAAEMASGVRKLMETDVGISVTGIAGPTGGSDEKPVGMIVLGVDIQGKTTTNIEYFSGGRNQVKKKAGFSLLKNLKENLEAIK
ncbi:MAG: CinA family protein [candidate division WOR-3 bacterium]|nr:CinA family protein [candidate division WOR-3 bacterium]